MNIPRGKTRIVDHFLELIPSHWDVTGNSFRHTLKGLQVFGDVSLTQTTLTTFGFFRFRVQVELQGSDVVRFFLLTAHEEFSFVVTKDESSFQINDEVKKTISTQADFTLQWILNDERISLQQIGNGISTLASRQACASFYQQPFVVGISTSFQEGSAMTLLESDYEFVNE